MDVFDQATELERIERESALRQAAAGTFQEGPEWIDGKPCCRECGEPIPEARLKAIPGVGLCLSCQQEWKCEDRNWRSDPRLNDGNCVLRVRKQ